MEINTNLIIGVLFVAILILLFSKITVSLKNNGNNDNKYNNSNTYIRPMHQTNINSPVTQSSRNLTLAQVQGLPLKDSYMSNSLKTQIDKMEDKFYYNNCRWEPNF